MSAARSAPAHGGMVGADRQIALPWLAGTLHDTLATQRGHALLLHGPAGVGQFTLALALAQAWLCEADAELATRPCGVCASCRLMQAHSHPDLLVLVPEAQREALGFAVADDGDGEGGEEKSGKRKPSKEIRVEEVRRVVGFAQTTSARGRGKVALLFPAERMNGISANTLLKTLEEPSGQTRFILAGSAIDTLLPTIRSRCQSVPMHLPDAAAATAWLASRGVADAAVLLQAAGGQPEEALAWAEEGIEARGWLELPARLRQGDASSLAAWPLARAVDALLKLCHDALRVAAQAAPRYFPASAVPASTSPDALLRWQAELQRVARHAEHPWNAGLLLESLAQQAAAALQPARAA